MLEEIVNYLSTGHLWLWGPFLILVLCGLGLPIPEDIILVSAGILTYIQKESWVMVSALMMFAVLGGDSCIYFIGRKFGKKFLQSRWGRRVFRVETIEQAEGAFSRWGTWVVFVSRFLPGLRAAVFFSSGALHYAYWRFLIMDAFAAIISVPLWVFLGYWGMGALGDPEDIQELAEKYQGYFFMILGVLLFFGILYFWKRWHKKKRSHT